jgi:hypothetical protein
MHVIAAGNEPGFAGNDLKTRPLPDPVLVLLIFFAGLNSSVIFLRSALGGFRPVPFDAQAIACGPNQLRDRSR